jgi:putative phosphoesterase
MDIAVIGDTHVPSRAQEIPEPFRNRIRDADHVIHTGDFDSEGALADQRALAPELTAVAGNMDPRIGLPTVATVELEGVEFVVTHGTGSPGGWERRVAETALDHAETESPVAVAGHTHEVVETTHEGIRLLNPGSTTGASPATRTTMMTVRVAEGGVDVTVHEL